MGQAEDAHEGGGYNGPALWLVGPTARQPSQQGPPDGEGQKNHCGDRGFRTAAKDADGED